MSFKINRRPKDDDSDDENPFRESINMVFNTITSKLNKSTESKEEPNEIEILIESFLKIKVLDRFKKHKFAECLRNWCKLSAILDFMYPTVHDENYQLYDNKKEFKRLQYAMR